MFKLLQYNVKHIVQFRNYSYKSDLSLEKIYPSSKLKLFTPSTPEINNKKFDGYIPIDQLDITYSRSTGPGGQNVNTTNTKVDVRFNVANVTWISDSTKNKIMSEFKNRINKDGYFVIRSDLTRYQQMNLADALEKLRNFIRSIETEPNQPSEESLEKKRKQHERQSAQRLMIKRERSFTKSQRQAPNVDF